jgi:hypothetical protein
MVPSEYWRGPGRRPAHRPVITTGAMRSPERDAEASTTLRRAGRDWCDGHQQADLRCAWQLYPGALPDCERMVAAMNFDNLVAVLAVAAAVPLILAAVPRVPVPGPVLEIVAGIVLGPAVLDLVKPDQAVRLVSTIGLAFLLFLAGLEIDVRHFRGPRARLAGLALGLSALLALIIGIALHATGVVESPLLVGSFSSPRRSA